MFNIRRFAAFAGAWKTHKRSMARHWTRDELKKHQQERLVSLVTHAVHKSAFYRELYHNIKISGGFCLTDLPVIDKSLMMENYDRFVTDPRLSLAGLRAHLQEISHDDLYVDQYRILTSSGSTGLRGIFAFNRREWQIAIATGLRTSHYAGLKAPRLPIRWRMATIGAGSPLHVTGRYYRCVDVGAHKVLRLTPSTPIDRMVAALNDFQPDFIFSYSSIASLLAIEQIEKRLSIHPRSVSTNAEVRTGEMEENIRQAWGVTPFNTYGMTEAGLVLANDCSCHHGLHVNEDFFIAETVDENNRPVPDGQSGAKLLITNLYNYTQPLIRYEISDIVAFSDTPCECGHPFKTISSIGGRSDEIIYLNRLQGGEIPVHPHNLRSPIAEITEIKQYQIIQEDDGLHLTISLRHDAPADVAARKLEDKFVQKLSSLGAVCPALHIKIVGEIERDERKMGKLRLIKSNLDRASTRRSA